MAVSPKECSCSRLWQPCKSLAFALLLITSFGIPLCILHHEFIRSRKFSNAENSKVGFAKASSPISKAHYDSPDIGTSSEVSDVNASESKDLLIARSSDCERKCRPPGSESIPEGIVTRTSNYETVPPVQSSEKKMSLLAIPVGIKQKEVVNQIVSKFSSTSFRALLFHYDGIVDEWKDLPWSDDAVHISAKNQTKWWFAKRFLHPDIVDDYDYIFLWDEDLGLENFDPSRYLSIVKTEGLEISQPAVDTRSRIHHKITARLRKHVLHRRIYTSAARSECNGNETGPPCTGWVEMMAPVFSRAAWRCVWHMIQNDLVYGWGLDYKLGYCAQGHRTLKVGVVDQEYIYHMSIPSLGGPNKINVRLQSYNEMKTFQRRWNDAVAKDKCWRDPYPSDAT